MQSYIQHKVKKICLAFDSFKGCISASEACATAAEGIAQRFPSAEIVQIPLSDGGEGLVECLRGFIPMHLVQLRTHGPLMEEITASYAISDEGTTAYMEMAATSGLTLVPAEKRNPTLTTTYGVGEMILDAHHRGCKHIVMGIGGSATCDGGKGMLQAILDKHPAAATPTPALSCDIIRNLQENLPHISVHCDVNNPLYGDNGAACVFAPQKGATPCQVAELDKRLRDFALEAEQNRIASPQLAHHPGAGAAGGLGYGLMAYLGATLNAGIDLVLQSIGFESLITGADLIITGEGKSDRQTIMGKVPAGVLKVAKRHNIPVHIVSGTIEDTATLLDYGFASVNSINEGDSRPLHILMLPDVATENLKEWFC